jgi:hypothetical protein
MKKIICVLVCITSLFCVSAQEREIKDYKLIAPA